MSSAGSSGTSERARRPGFISWWSAVDSPQLAKSEDGDRWFPRLTVALVMNGSVKLASFSLKWSVLTLGGGGEELTAAWGIRIGGYGMSPKLEYLIEIEATSPLIFRHRKRRSS
jgi:hypothetical protein